MKSPDVRASVLAGTWYPAGASDLRLSVEAYLSKSSDVQASLPESSPAGAPASKVRALILPHAGHKYSGRTCGAGVRHIRGRAAVRRLILMGPSHRTYVSGAVLSGAGRFETPLGEVAVDRDAVRILAAGGIPVSDEPHTREHCLEVLLPFFQVALSAFQIVPILIGHLSAAARQHLARQIQPLMNDDTILVASSDFTHYGDDFDYTPDVGGDPRAGVRRLDEGAIERIRALDAEGLIAYRDRTGATICGIQPIAVAIEALPKSARIDCVDYSQSADVTGETDHMVSYAALVARDA